MRQRRTLNGLNKPQNASASLRLDQMHSRDADMVYSTCKEKKSPCPNDPKTISFGWIALQTSFAILYHPINFKGPFNQQNQEPGGYYSRFKTFPDCCALWSRFGRPVSFDRAFTVCSSRVTAQSFSIIRVKILVSALSLE